MQFLIIILLAILILGIGVIIFILVKKNKDNKGQDEIKILSEKLSQITQQNENLRNAMDNKLSEVHTANQNQFGKTTDIMRDVTREANRLMSDIQKQSSRIMLDMSDQNQKAMTDVSEKLTKLDETNKRVIDFSSQLQNLQDILKNPKQRGVLGEYFLEETLKNVLPPNSYQMQYEIGKDGDGKKLIVDAVVFVKDKIIPVDSKFSLENYERILNCNNSEERKVLERQLKNDLKTRIDETSKYIMPEYNTFEFAFMFIPSEAIYYDLLVNKIGSVTTNVSDMIEYAFKQKNVIIVSPTSFLAYLQTVLQGLRAMQIEESAKDIRKNVEKLRKHISSYDIFLNKVGSSLSTTVNHYNNAYNEFKKVDRDVSKITEKDPQIENLSIDRPNMND